MPRTARKKSKSGIYHIILRGINRQTIFEDDEDAEKFLQTLEDYKEKSGYKLYAYCLMGNHVHLLLREGEEDLGTAMKRIGASYVYWYNWKYDRCGHLFQDRYKSETVEDDHYFLTVLRYIHQNPLKAGMVKDVAAYRWSSYSQFADQTGRDSSSFLVKIEVDFVLALFNSDRKKAIESFKAFHETSSSEACLDIRENRKLKDNEAIEIIKKVCNVPCCTEVQKIEKDRRNSYLKELKEKGLSTRQIARLTGVSRGIILKA